MTKTTQTGQELTITHNAGRLRVAQGKSIVGTFEAKLLQASAAQLAQTGAEYFIARAGKPVIGLTADEAATLQAEIDGAQVATVSPRKALAAAVSAANSAVRNDTTGNPVEAYEALAAAEAALAEYDTAHPEEAAQIAAEWQAAQAARKAETAQSFIGRGLD